MPPAAPASRDPRVVTSPLNVDLISAKLSELGILSDWTHVLAGLRHGFNTGVDTVLTESIILPNHSSTASDKEFIDRYIATEQARFPATNCSFSYA